MSQTSPTLALPYMQPAQAQKHVTHNEALRILDAVTQLSVLSATLADPPAQPNAGDSYILPLGPSGAWAGQGGKLAVYDGTAWQFLAPAPGWRADVIPTGEVLRFDGVSWGPALPLLQNLPQLGVNATADATNRLTVSAGTTLLNHDGDGHQLKINKATPGDTASLLFQTGFSGRAEMGSTGTDDFAIKVSPDGSTFQTAMEVEAATGQTTTRKRFFSGHLLGNQTGIPDKTHTTIAFNTAPQNDGAMLDTATGQLTPLAGAISAVAGAYATGLSAGTICTLGVWKNGAILAQKIYYASAGGDIGMDVALHDLCSGSDYYEIVVYITTAGSGTLNGSPVNTYFRGFHH
jgi:hypothetical protein